MRSVTRTDDSYKYYCETQIYICTCVLLFLSVNFFDQLLVVVFIRRWSIITSVTCTVWIHTPPKLN